MNDILKLGISSCPNDTFMFDALINRKIDNEGLSFKLSITDIENLNKSAIDNDSDISKISYAVYPGIAENYVILDSGSAIGYNNGPLLVSKRKIYPDEVKVVKIAIPGKHTTANLLLSIIFPEAKFKTEYLFSDIEDVVLSGEMDAGLIIHENRFTYEKKGLRKISDLGEIWYNRTNSPIPLGAIVANRKLPAGLIKKVNNLIRKSIEFAFQNPNSSYNFVKKHSFNLDDEIIKKHIDLYVNDYSITMGDKGRQSIKELFKKAMEVSIIPEVPDDIFIKI
jgi:1,4-dihydroxy-6-naphthoate synthase